jgi:hypothetical protein
MMAMGSEFWRDLSFGDTGKFFVFFGFILCVVVYWCSVLRSCIGDSSQQRW